MVGYRGKEERHTEGTRQREGDVNPTEVHRASVSGEEGRHWVLRPFRERRSKPHCRGPSLKLNGPDVRVLTVTPSRRGLVPGRRTSRLDSRLRPGLTRCDYRFPSRHPECLPPFLHQGKDSFGSAVLLHPRGVSRPPSLLEGRERSRGIGRRPCRSVSSSWFVGITRGPMGLASASRTLRNRSRTHPVPLLLYLRRMGSRDQRVHRTCLRRHPFWSRICPSRQTDSSGPILVRLPKFVRSRLAFRERGRRGRPVGDQERVCGHGNRLSVQKKPWAEVVSVTLLQDLDEGSDRSDFLNQT